MLNGLSRFHDFPETRFRTAERIIQAQAPDPQAAPPTAWVELDMGRLFQGLWLDWYEELMPRYAGKNLVCAACKLGMHAKAVLYCRQNAIPLLLVGYAAKQDYYPEQTPAFMERMAAFSENYGVTTRFPLYQEFEDEQVTRHLLESFGLPSTGGGERKCLFCQTRTTATETEIGAYLDDMLPTVRRYLDHTLAGRVREAALCFPPGR